MPSRKGRDNPNYKHGMHGTLEYRSWKHMKGRCYNLRDNRYPEYGGRGISICPQWEASFETFYHDMGAAPGEGYSLDRIDVNGNYEPSNCRWADTLTQARNKRKARNNTSGTTGVFWKACHHRWVVEIRVDSRRLSIGTFKDKNLAIAARKVAEIKYYDPNKLILLEE